MCKHSVLYFKTRYISRVMGIKKVYNSKVTFSLTQGYSIGNRAFDRPYVISY